MQILWWWIWFNCNFFNIKDRDKWLLVLESSWRVDSPCISLLCLENLKFLIFPPGKTWETNSLQLINMHGMWYFFERPYLDYLLVWSEWWNVRHSGIWAIFKNLSKLALIGSSYICLFSYHETWVGIIWDHLDQRNEWFSDFLVNSVQFGHWDDALKFSDSLGFRTFF